MWIAELVDQQHLLALHVKYEFFLWCQFCIVSLIQDSDESVFHGLPNSVLNLNTFGPTPWWHLDVGACSRQLNLLFHLTVLFYNYLHRFYLCDANVGTPPTWHPC